MTEGVTIRENAFDYWNRAFFRNGESPYEDTWPCAKCGAELRVSFHAFKEEVRVDCNRCHSVTWCVSRMIPKRHDPLAGWNLRHPNFELDGGDTFFIRVVDIDPSGGGWMQ